MLRRMSSVSPFRTWAGNSPRDNPPYTVHVTCNRNNTIATLTTGEGRVLCWASAGTIGLKKANRGTSDAGYQTMVSLADKTVKLKNMSDGIHLRMNGFGPGRSQIFRAIKAIGWNVMRISDYTPYRHAGCRPRKMRRL